MKRASEKEAPKGESCFSYNPVFEHLIITISPIQSLSKYGCIRPKVKVLSENSVT
jgi:hypothetical protein